MPARYTVNPDHCAASGFWMMISFQSCFQCLHSQLCTDMAAVESCHHRSVKQVNNATVISLPSIFHKNIGKICTPFFIWLFRMRISCLDDFQTFYSSPLFVCRFFGVTVDSDPQFLHIF